LTDRLPRVERRVGILEDHLHLAPQRPHLAPAELRDVAPLEEDPSGGRFEELEDEAGSRRLAAAGLTDKANGLTGIDLEARILDGVNTPDFPLKENPARDREVLRQVLDTDERIPAGALPEVHLGRCGGLAQTATFSRRDSRSTQRRRLSSTDR
jgi:hypothetical protein